MEKPLNIEDRRFGRQGIPDRERNGFASVRSGSLIEYKGGDDTYFLGEGS